MAGGKATGEKNLRPGKTALTADAIPIEIEAALEVTVEAVAVVSGVTEMATEGATDAIETVDLDATGTEIEAASGATEKVIEGATEAASDETGMAIEGTQETVIETGGMEEMLREIEHTEATETEKETGDTEVETRVPETVTG